MGGAPTRHRTVIGVLLALVLAATACSAPVRLPDDATPLPSAQNGDAEPEEERELSLAEQLEALEAENEAARAAMVQLDEVFAEEPKLLTYIAEQIDATILRPPERRSTPVRPVVELPEAPEPAAPGLVSCGDRLECGFVTVPTDYADLSVGTLEIAINVYRTADPDQRIGYLFTNPGGPGASGTEFVEGFPFFGFPDELMQRFDIVGFDPRGVGLSEPRFACGEGTQQFQLLTQIDESIDTIEEIEIGDAAARLCTDSMGRAGALLHSEYVARDMDQIRRALGEEQISYLGFSYGSALGGWYASIFPERVRAMVVDAAANPLANPFSVAETVEWVINSYGQFEIRLDDALTACRDAGCPIYNDGDPHGYWFDMVDKFEIVRNAKGGNGDAVFLGIIGHLYSESLWPTLYDAIHQLSEFDDPTLFIEAIELAGTVDEASVTAHINCLDQWALFPGDALYDKLENEATVGVQVSAELDGAFPLLDAVHMPPPWDACLFYEAIDPPIFGGVYDGGGVPILVIGNRLDPFTPLVESRSFAEDTLADGRLVTVSHPDHTVYPANGCVNNWVHQVLFDATYPDGEKRC